MPNPVTHALVRQLNDPHLSRFVANWDTLEALVIRVFRSKAVTPQDEDQFRQTRAWLEENYPRWQAALRPHWHGVKAAGAALEGDPFLSVMHVERAGELVENWSAVQTLPAARETLNRWLLEQVEKKSRDEAAG